MFPELMRDDVFRLETPRLWLRWPRAADAARIADYAGDADVALQTVSIPHPYPMGAAAEFVLQSRAANLTGGEIVLALTQKQRPNDLIGCIRLRATRDNEATLGYWLGKPFWGQGLMCEAATSLIALSMRTTRIAAIHADARRGNAASRALLVATGFAPRGFGVAPAPARGGALAVEHFRLARAAASDAHGAGAGTAAGELNIGASTAIRAAAAQGSKK